MSLVYKFNCGMSLTLGKICPSQLIALARVQVGWMQTFNFLSINRHIIFKSISEGREKKEKKKEKENIMKNAWGFRSLPT